MDGKTLHVMPTTSEDLARCSPIYETHTGFPAMTQDEWIHMAEASRSEGVGFDVMPVTIRAYIERIENLAGAAAPQGGGGGGGPSGGPPMWDDAPIGEGPNGGGGAIPDDDIPF